MFVCLGPGAAAYEFFNYINLFYGTVSEFCNPKFCAVMSAGEGYAVGLQHGRCRLAVPPC